MHAHSSLKATSKIFLCKLGIGDHFVLVIDMVMASSHFCKTENFNPSLRRDFYSANFFLAK